MDTFWDKADRGAVSAPAGYTGYTNVFAGQTPGTSRYTPVGVGGPVYGAGGVYGRPRTSPSAVLAKRDADLLKQANDANDARYGEGRSLLGLEDPLAWQKAGFASPDAYAAHRARLAGEAAATTPPPLPGPNPAGVGAQGGFITPQALASRVQAKQRGIYNSSTALNQEAVTNSLALQDAGARNQGLSMQQQQLAESKQRADAAQEADLRNQRLNWIYQRNDQAPNLDRLSQIAATEGQGNTEGLGYPQAQGGGGGGGGRMGVGGNGYGLPTYTPEQAPQMTPAQIQAMTAKAQLAAANRAAAYDTLRKSRMAGLLRKSPAYGVDVPQRRLAYTQGLA